MPSTASYPTAGKSQTPRYDCTIDCTIGIHQAIPSSIIAIIILQPSVAMTLLMPARLPKPQQLRQPTQRAPMPVSYTHLTLPTIYSV